MTFEKDFPGLKEKIIERKCTELENPRIGESLGFYVEIKDIQENCKDNQRIREAIDKITEQTLTTLIGDKIKKELNLE